MTVMLVAPEPEPVQIGSLLAAGLEDPEALRAELATLCDHQARALIADIETRARQVGAIQVAHIAKLAPGEAAGREKTRRMLARRGRHRHRPRHRPPFHRISPPSRPTTSQPMHLARLHTRVSQCEIDHNHPHSDGGSTNPGNGAQPCGRHNPWKQRHFTIWPDPNGHWHTHRPNRTEIT